MLLMIKMHLSISTGARHPNILFAVTVIITREGRSSTPSRRTAQKGDRRIFPLLEIRCLSQRFAALAE